MKLAKATVDEFFDIPVSARDDMVHDLGAIFQEHQAELSTVTAQLTRCNQDSRIIRLVETRRDARAAFPPSGAAAPRVSTSAAFPWTTRTAAAAAVREPLAASGGTLTPTPPLLSHIQPCGPQRLSVFYRAGTPRASPRAERHARAPPPVSYFAYRKPSRLRRRSPPGIQEEEEGGGLLEHDEDKLLELEKAQAQDCVD
ncbi:hypothetical protein PR202_ga27126 [Eleusine coracana subsp. coracana]|uniref:Uncharacterized protein n=1 Tax=Eleusine coracana subsp. coracana TaxID=191504 RepID=A0AAV5DG12_ELECO|nr:hypothetical protein PR202_ga27126 [Eleusine coracana subsp. coracana]